MQDPNIVLAMQHDPTWRAFAPLLYTADYVARGVSGAGQYASEAAAALATSAYNYLSQPFTRDRMNPADPFGPGLSAADQFVRDAREYVTETARDIGKATYKGALRGVSYATSDAVRKAIGPRKTVATTTRAAPAPRRPRARPVTFLPAAPPAQPRQQKRTQRKRKLTPHASAAPAKKQKIARALSKKAPTKRVRKRVARTTSTFDFNRPADRLALLKHLGVTAYRKYADVLGC